MKRRFIAITILAIGVFGLYWFSTSERRNADRIVDAIEEYRAAHHRLPDPDDHDVMKSLGFELGAVGWYPNYEADEHGFYEITLLGGFDGPYWIYHSRNKNWTEGYPTIRPSNQ